MKEETYRTFKCQNKSILTSFDEIESKINDIKKHGPNIQKSKMDESCKGCENLFVMCRSTGEVKGMTPNRNCPKRIGGCSYDTTYYYPTIREMIELWYPHYARRNNLKTAVGEREGFPKMKSIPRLISGIKRSARIARIGLDEPIINVNRKRLKIGIVDWYDNLKIRKQNDDNIKIPSELTVRALLEYWINLTPKWLREMAEEDGTITVPRIDLPKFTVHEKQWRKPSEAQYIQYGHYVEELEKTHSIEWAIVRFQRETGCRNGDVKDAKWDNFKIRNGKCIYTYTDNKTGKSSPQVVQMEFLDKLLSWRKYYFSKNGPNKYFRIGHENDPHIFGSIHIVGDDGKVKYIPTQNSTAWKNISNGMKKCGICDLRTDKKGAYQNRAMKAQELREKYGEEIMNAVLHNSKRVSSRYSELDVVKKMTEMN